MDTHDGYCDLRFKGIESLCYACVRRHAERLRRLTALEEDSRVVQESMKKFDSMIKYSNENPVVTKDCSWISKDAMKTWKKCAKMDIEKLYSSQEERQNEIPIEDTDLCDLKSGVFNNEILCSHGMFRMQYCAQV